MIIPTVLKIGGHWITVDCSQELENINGEFSATKNTIKICKTLPDSQKEQALFHEILHAINSEMDGNLVGHIMLESIAQQLYQVFSDNKMLL